MSTSVRVAKRLARAVIPSMLLPAARKAAIKAGWIEGPPFQYPFEQMMAQYPSVRPNYRWGTLCAASLAKALKYERICVIEFGVAGGNGLIELERSAEEAERLSGVKIDVYGFDTGIGLTKPCDYRDLPQLWSEGFYKMDVPALQKRLTRAKLVLGPVEDTVPKFIAEHPAPVGFISFDLDMYHPTMQAFELLKADQRLLLPRVVCYFDDIIAFSHSDFNGERLAISDFNGGSDRRKISKIYGLRYALNIDQVWTEMMYMLHGFDHARYCDNDHSNVWRELPLISS